MGNCDLAPSGMIKDDTNGVDRRTCVCYASVTMVNVDCTFIE